MAKRKEGMTGSPLRGSDWDAADNGQRARLLVDAISKVKMDQDKIRKLLEVVSPDDQVKIKVLYNGVVTCISEYQSGPTAARLKAWEAAESSLRAIIDEMTSRHMAGEVTFRNGLAVHKYLESKGWKIGKTLLYQHCNEGKLTKQADGTYSVKDVDRYAGAYLQPMAGRKADDRDLDDIAKQKLRSEANILAHKETIYGEKAKAATGRYIPRADFEIALAQRAAIFRADLEGMCRGSAAEVVHMSGGDPGKVPDVIDYLLGRVEGVVARYSEDRAIAVPSPLAADDRLEAEDDDAGSEAE